ncbi:GntR family transcriptional regulator [Streptomyces sp. R21]|uniref:GntR family transcriptional regulator n=1 Tax=Streptomyces sp. R21 TaxID=3238627 RepID=A0AB39PC62_9ACTN
MGGQRSGDGGGKEFLRVSAALRSRIAEGTYALGGQLPAQRALAEEFAVSRDTVQRVLKELADEGWIESRQGSGSRVIENVIQQTQRIRPVTPRQPRAGRSTQLLSIIGDAFRQPQVALDIFTLTSETLDTQIRVQADRIRAGEIGPERIALRMLLPAEDMRLPYPRARHAPDDPRVPERTLSITRRHTASLRAVLQELKVQELVPEIEFQIRHVELAPPFKLYLLNGTQALQGFYEVIERPIPLEDGTALDVLDVLGLGATLMHYVEDGDPESVGSVFVARSRDWFESVWNLLAT